MTVPKQADIVERLRSSEPLPACPYDRLSPHYWTAPNDKPCPICGTLNDPDAPDLCRGADTRIMGEAADEIERLRALPLMGVQCRDREMVARAIDPEAWTEVKCDPEDREIWARSRQMQRNRALAKADAVLALLPKHTGPSDADLRAFGASDAACYLWPEDTGEHKALRAAYIRGAADCGGHTGQPVEGWQLVPKEPTQEMREMVHGDEDALQTYRDILSAAPASPQPREGWQPSESERLDIVADVCMAVAELPDRTSPEDRPDMMLVTHDELQNIVLAALPAPPVVADPGEPRVLMPGMDAYIKDAGQ